jgi:hypothetical protein
MASGGKKLLHDPAAILLQHAPAALSGLTAGMDKVAIHTGGGVQVIHQGEQRGFLPSGDLSADGAPAAMLLGCLCHGLNPPENRKIGTFPTVPISPLSIIVPHCPE